MSDSNQPSFTFGIEGLDPDTFRVVRFSGEEGLSKWYQFDVSLASRDDSLDFSKAVSSRATLTVSRPGSQDVSWQGIVRGFTQQRRVDGVAYYRAELVPAAWTLTLDMHSQIWLNKDIPQVVRECLAGANFSNGPDFVVHTSRSYPKRDYVCQYNESRHAFLARWMERNGLYFFFDHSGAREKMVITENLTVHGPHPCGQALIYTEGSGLESVSAGAVLKSFNHQSRVLPREVMVRDYNYRTPNLDIQGTADVDEKGVGTVYAHGGRIRSPHEALLLAHARAQELSCKKDVFFGESDAAFVQPGYVVSVGGHYRQDMNRSYLVMEVKHEGSQEGPLTPGAGAKAAGDKLFYRNAFAAIPSDVQYRSPSKAPWPRISGLLSAFIDAEGDGRYAELDEHGRYKVIMPFDVSGRKDGQASIPLRMAQPYAGQGHGMHFPLHKGAEVLVGFMEGNPDRPVIVAAAPNTALESVVTSRNQTMANITSAGGNQIHMQDQDGGQHITLQSPVSGSAINVGAPKGQEEDQAGFTPSQDQIDKYHTLQAQYQTLTDAAASYQADQTKYMQGGIALTTDDTFSVKASWCNTVYLIENTQTNLGLYSCNTIGDNLTFNFALVQNFNFVKGIQYTTDVYELNGPRRRAEASKDHVIGQLTEFLVGKDSLATSVNDVIAEKTKSLVSEETLAMTMNAVVTTVDNVYATKEEMASQREQIDADLEVICMAAEATFATKEELSGAKTAISTEMEQISGTVSTQAGDISRMAGDITNMAGDITALAGAVQYV